MLENIYTELESIIAPMEHVSVSHAKQLFELVNEKIEQMTNSHIIDLLRRPPGTDGSYLLPFVSSYEKSTRGPIKQDQITSQNIGVWPLVYEEKKPLWLKKIINLDRNTDALNHFDNTRVDKKYLWFSDGTDEILVVPLVFEGSFMGIYSIEFPIHSSISQSTVNELVHLAHPFSKILWKTEVAYHFEGGVNDAMTRFRRAISVETNSVLSSARDGFFARPFRLECEQLEDHVKQYFAINGVRVSSYNPTPGAGVVAQDIMDKIEASHFGIVDLTGYNSNVVLELGMLLAFRKKTIFLINQEHDEEPPFDLKPYHRYLYKIAQDDIKLKQPASGDMISIDNVLAEFLSELQRMPSFQNAKPHPTS